MPSSFRDSLEAHTSKPSSLRLPFCHVASAKTIIGYIEKARVTTDVICDIFGEKLNYFFYGRAAYRPRDSGTTTVVIDRPSALLVKPAAITVPRTVYPFDTGGFSRYSKANGHSLPDFALNNDLSDCERVIERHWETHQHYIQVDMNGFHRRIDPNCFAVEAYSDIVRETDSNVADDRRSSIEVTSLLDVAADQDSILGIVLPYGYAGRDSILSLQSAGIKVEKYGYWQKDRAHDMAVVIELAFKIVENWMKGA